MGVGTGISKGLGNEFEYVEAAYNSATAKQLKDLRDALISKQNICDARGSVLGSLLGQLDASYLNTIKQRWYGKAGTNQWIEEVGGINQPIMDIDLPGQIHQAYVEGTIGMIDLKLTHPGWTCVIWGQCYHRIPFYHLTATGDPTTDEPPGKGVITLVICVPENDKYLWDQSKIARVGGQRQAVLADVEIGPPMNQPFLTPFARNQRDERFEIASDAGVRLESKTADGSRVSYGHSSSPDKD